ncbi:MAG: amylo-alpha-1,6-glucosidase [Clostridia bacterium]|nr:amylo-alpha-1,6-glucosidase [Clostridia bacterium]
MDARIGLIVSEESDEVRSALCRFPTLVPVAMDALGREDLGRFSALWWHAARKLSVRAQSDVLDSIGGYLKEGGGLLLSLLACELVQLLGIESRPFDEVYSGAWNEEERYGWKWDFVRRKGFQCALSHPLFRGMDSCSYTWQSGPGKAYYRAGYTGHYPNQGSVVAVRKNFIHIAHDVPEILEYHCGNGRVLAISSLLFLSEEGGPRYPELMSFTANALSYVAGQTTDGEARYWPAASVRRIKPCGSDDPCGDGGLGDVRLPRADALAATGCGIGFTLSGGPAEFFDLAGRRCLVLGHTDGSVDEIWGHPVQLAKRIAVVFEVSGRSYPVTETARRTVIYPDSVTVEHSVAGHCVRQTIFAAADSPGAVMSFTVDSPTPVSVGVRVEFEADLRVMWPYPLHILNSLCMSMNNGRNVLLVRDGTGEFSMAFGMAGAGAAAATEDGVGGNGENENGFRVSAACTVEPGEPALCAFAGGKCSCEEVLGVLHALIEHGSDLQGQAARYYDCLAHTMTSVSSPDGAFNEGYQCAKVGVDKFYATTPGIGSGFLAGYSTTGETAFSIARPGYAWYFGRDSEYTALAVDAYGDTEKVRENLRLLIDHQHSSGKIFHEITTSGVAHYDAADSTPLFVVLMEHYLRSSGDVSFIRDNWHGVKRAMDFLYATDTDQDGLIENKGVGHGWIEGGTLSPTYVSFDLAGVWAEALRCGSRLAREVGDAALAEKWRASFERVRTALNSEFWDPAARWFAFAKNEDGSYCSGKTCLASIPMCFGLIDTEKALPVLSSLGTHEYSADWGVRLIGESSADFDPEGYHQGSVWPLFTGWVARAEYEYHRPLQGFVHLMNNTLLYRHEARGCVPEVLHGKEYRFAGVCRHQAWSEAMVLYPAIEGLLGIRRDVPRNCLQVCPHLPPNWGKLSIRRIPFGDSIVDIEIEQTLSGALFAFRREGDRSRAVDIELSPGILSLNSVKGVMVDGRETTYDVRDYGQEAHVTCRFPLIDSAVAEFRYSVDLWVVPAVPRPDPGDCSRSIRVLEVSRGGRGEVDIEVEGLAGATEELTVLCDRGIERVVGARVSRVDSAEHAISVEFDGHDGWRRRHIRVFTR